MDTGLVKLLVVLALLAATNGFARYTKPQILRPSGIRDPGDPLILTKYIKDGKIADGRPG